MSEHQATAPTTCNYLTLLILRTERLSSSALRGLGMKFFIAKIRTVKILGIKFSNIKEIIAIRQQKYLESSKARFN